MAEGVDRAAWNRTAQLWALLANAWKGKDSPTYTPRMIHPYYPDRLPAAGDRADGRLELTPDNLDLFAQAFVRANAKRK